MQRDTRRQEPIHAAVRGKEAVVDGPEVRSCLIQSVRGGQGSRSTASCTHFLAPRKTVLENGGGPFEAGMGAWACRESTRSSYAVVGVPASQNRLGNSVVISFASIPLGSLCCWVDYLLVPLCMGRIPFPFPGPL